MATHNIWEATTQRKTLTMKREVFMERLILFWNSSHLSTLLNLSSRKSDKQWVMMVMHDFIIHSWEGLVVKRHSPGGLWCDSHMSKGFVLLKTKHKGTVDLKQLQNWDMNEITKSHTMNTHLCWTVALNTCRYESLHEQYVLWGLSGGSSSGGKTEVCGGKMSLQREPLVPHGTSVFSYSQLLQRPGASRPISWTF